MPSFFIIAFIWRGLMFPGSIFLTTLPYSYRCTIIKCKHLRARKEGYAAGKETIAASNNEDIVARADLRISRDNMFCKRVFSLCHKRRDIFEDYNPITGWCEDSLKPSCPFDP
jgi:hypothetical protein